MIKINSQNLKTFPYNFFKNSFPPKIQIHNPKHYSNLFTFQINTFTTNDITQKFIFSNK